MQLADLALGQGDDLDTGEGKPLVEPCHVLQVARQAVQGLRHDHIEFICTGILQQFLVTRSKGRGATGRAVSIGMEISPTSAFDESPALADLILDRGLALVLAGIAGVDDGTHG